MADARRLGSLAQVPELDRWVAFTTPGRVEVRTGKVELGQGILTAELGRGLLTVVLAGKPAR